MDKKNKNIQDLRKMGFSQKTLSLLNESQVAVLLENIRKSETKEAEQTTKKITKLQPTDQLPPKTTVQQAKAMVTKPELTKTVDTAKNFDPSKTKGPNDIADDTELTETKNKKKKYNPWAVCTAQVGRKDKKKYEKCVMGVKEKIKEGRNPYEYLIESKMEEIVSEHLSPKMTKSDLMKLISEKQIEKPIGKIMSTKGETTEGETKTKEKEKVKTQPKTKPSHPAKNPSKAPHPAKAMMMKKETMEGETETETAPVRTTPAEPKTRPSHPGRKPNPDTEHAPAKAEKKKEEIINAIVNLIGKGK